MSAPFHRLLTRQLRNATRDDGSVDLAHLLASINECYLDHELSLKRIDRANALMAEELEEMLATREAAARDRAARLEEMEKAQTAIAASEARVRHLAYHDTLTGLPNRGLLSERLAHALEMTRRSGGGFAVHCIDLDQFKIVNDTFGHQTGDELIRAVAHVLSSLCRKVDTIARLGGDEFAIIQLGATPASAAGLAHRLVEALATPIDLTVGRVHVGCSVGVTIVEDPMTEPLEALRQADLALYRAKGNGRGQFAFFEPEMDAAVRTRRALQADLRTALTNGDIELAYQPQVDGAGQIVGVEALARWRHAERGVVPPTLFVPVAEECGLIVEFGFYTLRRAFNDAARWPRLKVAVNVSAHQLRMKDFVARVSALLSETGACPRQFELEITEGVLLGDDPKMHDTLHRLRELGFSMALDDFGTGYSSLSYLRRYPIDKIKIDRSFVTNLGVESEAEAVISTIVKLAQSLNLKVIAEGVETPEQRSALFSAGCNDIQGFLFGKPMPADAIDELLVIRSAPATTIAMHRAAGNPVLA